MMHETVPLCDEAATPDALRALAAAVDRALGLASRDRAVTDRRMRPDPYAGGPVRELSIDWEADGHSVRAALVEVAWVGWELVVTARVDAAAEPALRDAVTSWCAGRAK